MLPPPPSLEEMPERNSGCTPNISRDVNGTILWKNGGIY